MEALWFCIVLAMLATYAILDGFELGAGIVHLCITPTETERRTMLADSGSGWDGNEIWLLLAGGAFYCAFPAVSASRGFYLAAATLLSLLILRATGLRIRDRVEDPRSRSWLDRALGLASILLALSLGTAVGWMIRSVSPVSSSGPVTVWLPLLCGVSSLAVLTLQGAAWMAFQASGDFQLRCRRFASGLWWAVLLSYSGLAAVSLVAEPHLLENLTEHSWICACAVMALAGLVGARLCLNVDFDLGVFVSVSGGIAGLLASAATGLFPSLPPRGLTGFNIGSAHYATWLLAFALAAGYNVYRHLWFRNQQLPVRR